MCIVKWWKKIRNNDKRKGKGGNNGRAEKNHN